LLLLLWLLSCVFFCCGTRGSISLCFLFVCLFVGIKPGKLLYSASCVGRKVNPLKVITHEQRHKPRAYQRQFCLFVCLFVCWNKTRKTILRLLCREGSKPPGSDHTRAEAQTACIPKTAVRTTYLSLYGWHSTSWLAGSHPWTRQRSHLSHPQPPNGVPPCLVWRLFVCLIVGINPDVLGCFVTFVIIFCSIFRSLVFGLVYSHTASNPFFLSFFGFEDPSPSLDSADVEHPINHLGPKEVLWTGGQGAFLFLEQTLRVPRQVVFGFWFVMPPHS